MKKTLSLLLALCLILGAFCGAASADPEYKGELKRSPRPRRSRS